MHKLSVSLAQNYGSSLWGSLPCIAQKKTAQVYFTICMHYKAETCLLIVVPLFPN